MAKLFDDKPCLEIQYQYGNTLQDLQYVTIDCLTNYTRDEIKDIFKPGVSVDKIKDSATLFFLQSSTFPRTRLTNSAYKRCINQAKADYIVAPDSLDAWFGNNRIVQVIETEDTYYIVPNFWGSYYRSPSGTEYNNNPAKFILKYGYLVPKTKVLSVSNKVTLLQLPKKIYHDMQILLKSKTPVISEKSLSYKVDQQSETASKEDILSIIDMLQSSDQSVQGLGLKLLGNYNISSMAPLIKYIMGCIPSLQNCAAWNSVSVKSLRDSIGFYNFNSNSNIFYRYNEFCKTDSPEAQEILKTFIKKELTKGFNEIAKSVSTSIANLGLKISLNIDEEK